MSTDKITYRALMDAAIACFNDHGYHGTSIRDIATRAGLSSAMIYHHFGSKQQLLADFMRTIHEEAYERLQAAVISSPSDAGSRLDALVRAHVLTQTELLHESFVAKTELRALPPADAALVADKRALMQRLFDSVVEQGVQEGVFVAAHLRAASRAIVTMCTAVSDWYQPGGERTPEEIAQMYVDFARGVLRSTAAESERAPTASASGPT